MSPAVVSRAAPTTASDASVIAAVSGARRPTTPAPTSSRRPTSSSTRVWRRTTAYANSPTKTAPMSTVLNTDKESRFSARDGAVHRDDRRVGEDGSESGASSLVGGIEVDGGLRGPDREGREGEQARGDEDAVASPGEAEECAGAGEAAHATVTSSGDEL